MVGIIIAWFEYVTIHSLLSEKALIENPLYYHLAIHIDKDELNHIEPYNICIAGAKDEE
jgi:hypothetical protein